MNQETKKSIRQLVIYLVICAVAAVTAFLFRVFDWHFWPCAFYEISGLYCLSCGSTRAALALTRFDFVSSLLLNPLPLMIVALMVWMIVYEIRNIIRQEKRKFKWIPHAVLFMVAVTMVYFVWRNFGNAPTPDML